MNYIYSGKDYSRISETNYNKAFLYHTKINEKDLILSYWEAAPYHPAYVICRDRLTKSIIICARGSNNWADVVTDLDFNYLNFSIMKDKNKQHYIKMNYNNTLDSDIQKRIVLSPKAFINEQEQVKNQIRNLGESRKIEKNIENEEEIVKDGYAHSGMLVSALELHKEVSPIVRLIIIHLLLI